MRKRRVLWTVIVAMLAVTCIVVGISSAQGNTVTETGPNSLLAPAATLVVTSTADSGPGTLRQVLIDAVNGDIIGFDTGVFPPGNPQTITLSSTLPQIITDNLTIDGSNAGVILDGSGLGSGDGLHITSNGNAVKGLQILHFPSNGVQIDGGASDNTIGGANGTPGGACSGDCNLISGNGGSGIAIMDNDTMSNTVSGNYIGTDVSGTAVIGNDADGVKIDGASHNVIGGSTAGERNLISGNGADDWGGGPPPGGVGFYSAGHNTVEGNNIGTDVSGSFALPNKMGILMVGGMMSNSNLILRNLISGNDRDGISIQGSDTMTDFSPPQAARLQPAG